jgi:hypothetical protein
MFEQQQQQQQQQPTLSGIMQLLNDIISNIKSFETKLKIKSVPVPAIRSEKPKEPVKEQTNVIAPVIKIQIEIKVVSSPTIPVKNVEPTIDVQPTTISGVQEEPTVQIVPITVKIGNQHVQVSDVSVVQSNKTNYPITVTVDAEPPTFPIVPEVATEIPPTGPGPPARYNLRSTQKRKKD